MHYTESTSSSGVATAGNPRPDYPICYFTVDPSSASGTGTVTAKAVGASAFEPVYADGVALTVDLSATVSHRIEHPIEELKVTSDNAGDAFVLRVGGGQ